MNIQPGAAPPSRARQAVSHAPSQAAPAEPGLPPAGNGFLDTITRGMVTFAYEGGAVLQNDPALAVRQFATTVHEWNNRGYMGSDLQAWAPYVPIGARILIAGADVFRANSSFNTPGTSLLEKGLDVARVATDLMGVAGAVLRVVTPSNAALGTTLLGISQAADLVSHGARFGMHSAPRAKAWLKEHEEKKTREKARERERERRLDEQLGIATPPPATAQPLGTPATTQS